MSQRRHLPSRQDVDVENRLRMLFDQGYGVVAITDALDREFKKRAPSKSTVDRRVRALKALDTSGRWFMNLDTEPETAALILGTIAVVIEATGGRVRSLTNTEAAWIATIRAAYPDIDAWDSYRLTRLFITRDALEQPTDDLDTYLAFKPWRGDDHQRRYDHAVKKGWIEKAPLVMTNGDLIDLEEVRPEEVKIMTEEIRAAMEPTIARIVANQQPVLKALEQALPSILAQAEQLQKEESDHE